MTDAVLVIQKSKAQSEIWARILKSQDLVAITESPDANLRKLLQQASQGNQLLPTLMILEMSIETLNPYDFCRWAQEHYPALKVILTAQERIQVSEIEQRWAQNQGAYQLLPGFDYGHLPLSLTQTMELIMLALGKTNWQPDSLMPVIEELTAEFGQNGEHKTVIQPSETESETASSQVTESFSEKTEEKRRGIKLKPKVKRFRGLRY